MPETLPQVDRITANSFKRITNRVLEVQYGNGYKQIAEDGLNSNIDTWFIEVSPIEGADLTEYNTFLDTVGVTDWFTWTPIGEAVEKKWRIDKDSINRKMIHTTKFLLSFNITQSFDLG